MVNSIIPLAFDRHPFQRQGFVGRLKFENFQRGKVTSGEPRAIDSIAAKNPKKSGWKPHVAKIQVFRVWFLSIHSSRLFFHPIFRSEDHWGFLSVRDPQRRLVTEILMSGMDMDGQWWTCFMTSLMPSPDFLKDPGESGADEQFFLLLS